MPYKNIHRGARISPMKVRPVADMIRGKHVDEATTILELSPRRGAKMLLAALDAAVANADNDEAELRNLWIVDCQVDEGPTIKRFRPKDRGRAHPIKKRTSHITVAVEERS